MSQELGRVEGFAGFFSLLSSADGGQMTMKYRQSHALIGRSSRPHRMAALNPTASFDRGIQ